MIIDELIARDRLEIRAMVEGCCDEQQLGQWFLGANDQIDDIRDDVKSYQFCGTADAEWLKRVGGRLSMLTKVRRWTQGRMLALDMTPPWLPADPRMVEIRNLKKRLGVLTSALREAGIQVPS